MKILKSFGASLLILMLFSNTVLAASADSVAEAGGVATDDAIEVEQSYEFSSEYGYKYYIAVCHNTTDTDLDVSWDTVSYDKDGGILETGSSYTAYVTGGQEFVLYALFLDSEDATDYSYKISWEESDFIHPGFKDVTLQANVASNGKLILQATNNGSEDLSTVQASTLFFDASDKLVGFEDSYIVNSNYNVLAGETVIKDLSIPEGADHYETYYTAYRS